VKLFLFFIVAASLTSCGKFQEKFSKINEGFTRVHLDPGEDPLSTMDGGIMIYFINANDAEMGKAFGFTSQGDIIGKSVIVPNGNYRVFALGTTGANVLEGQAKCAKANNGNPVGLVGGTASIALNMTNAGCSFGNDTEFSTINSGNIGNTNFDTLTLGFCTGEAYPSCNLATGSSYRVRLKLLAGTKSGVGDFSVTPSDTLTSGCSPVTSGGGIASTYTAFIGGTLFSPPMEILVFSDSTCSSAPVGSVNLKDGIKKYLSVSSGSSVYLDSGATSNTSYLKFTFP
jgi:hypothetical protein